MQRLNKEKEIISQKILKITQSRGEIKTDTTQPISSYRRITQNDYSTNSSHFNQSNSLLNKTNLLSGFSLKDYTSGIKRGNNVIEETKKYQYTNNYKVVDKDEKPTNSKDIDHKKWGIRTRQSQATPLLPIKNKEDTNLISKYNSNYNNNTKNNVYISGSSQSNYITSNTSSLLNTNNLSKSPFLRQTYSSQKSSLSNNPNNNAFSIYSIVDTKKVQTKPFTLHERNNEVIKSESRSKLRFKNASITNTKNHSIVVTRNANKGGDVGSSKYNSNITNTGIYSINESRKNDKKEVIVSPRKNIVIQTTRSHKRSYNSTEPNKNDIYNINLRNQNNIYESKYNKNKNNNIKSNINDYSKSIVSNYVPKYSKYNVVETKTKLNEPITSKFNITSTITSKYTVNEPKTYKYKIKETLTSKYNTNSNKSYIYNNDNKYNISDNKYSFNDKKYNNITNKYNSNDNKYKNISETTNSKISTGYISYVRKPIEPSYNKNTNEQKSYKYESSKYSIKEAKPSYETKSFNITTDVKPSYEIKSKYSINISKPSYEVKSLKTTNEIKPLYEKRSIYSYNQTKTSDNKSTDNKYNINKTNNDNNYNYSRYRKVEIKKETVIKDNSSNLNNNKSSVQNESQAENKGYGGRFQFKHSLNINNNESDNKPYKSSRLVETEEINTFSIDNIKDNIKETDEKKRKGNS